MITGEAKRIRQTALALAEIDVLASLAHVAALRNYCRPVFDNSSDIEIVAGRHPVIEQQELSGGSERFVPNDLFLNSTTHTVLVLTGPNMGGKSTYLRQAALGGDSGADGIVRSGAFRPPWHRRPRVHPHWGERQSGARPIDLSWWK